MAFGELTGKGISPVAVALAEGGGVEAGKTHALRATLNNTATESKVSIFLGIGTISFRKGGSLPLAGQVYCVYFNP